MPYYGDDDDDGYPRNVFNSGLDDQYGVGGNSFNNNVGVGGFDSGLGGLGDLNDAGVYGGSGYDDQPYGGLGLGGLSLDNNDLQGGYGGGLGDTGLNGLGGAGGLGGYDSGYGGLGSGLGLGGLGNNMLDDPAYQLGGLDGAGYSAGGGLDDLGGDYTLGLGGGLSGINDSFNGGYGGGLGDGLDRGLGLDGIGDLDDYNGGLGLDAGGLGGFGGSGLYDLGLGNKYNSNFDLGFDNNNVGSGLESLGWSNYDLGLDNLGSGYGSTGLGGSNYLGDAALLGGAALGGAALGAAAGHYGGSRDYGHLDGGLSNNYGHGFGSTLYDSDLGILGNTTFGAGAYDGYGYGSGLASPTLRYSDLASYENRLYTDQAISQAERDSLLRDRMAWEALDDSARLSQWNNWDDGHRSRMGVNDGYWGSRYGASCGSGNSNSFYDPYYAAAGWRGPRLNEYDGLNYSYGYGAPNFYDNYSLNSVPYGLTAPVQNYYSDYLGTSSSRSLPLWSTDDSRWREAADLAYYQQRLAADQALSENERMRRWQERLSWEALDGEARRLRWAEMAEDRRERLGLGLIGSYAGSRYGSSGLGMTLPYQLPSQIAPIYQPYMSGRASNSTSYMDPGFARYNDFAAWATALKLDPSMAEAERRARWRERMKWEQLENDGARRERYASMPFKDRLSIGLSGGYWDSRFGLINAYDPRALNPMRFSVGPALGARFRPYQSKRVLARLLQAGDEGALAFADLVAFENGLRNNQRLTSGDKVRRWAARIRWQELNERDRRIQYFRMQEAERRMLGLGLASYFGRRYAAPLFMNGVRGLPPPRAMLPTLRAPLPENLRSVFAPVIARQAIMAPPMTRTMAACPMAGSGMTNSMMMPRQPLLSTSALSRAPTTGDAAQNLADRIRLSIAQKTEQLPGISPAQRLAATEQKRRILREMDNDRQMNTSAQVTEQERLRRLRQMGY